MTPDNDQVLREKACEAVDACLGQKSEIIDLVYELMRQLNELKKEVTWHPGNEE